MTTTNQKVNLNNFTHEQISTNSYASSVLSCLHLHYILVANRNPLNGYVFYSRSVGAGDGRQRGRSRHGRDGGVATWQADRVGQRSLEGQGRARGRQVRPPRTAEEMAVIKYWTA